MADKKTSLKTSLIYDNHDHGSVGDFLKLRIGINSSLSIISAYFTIHAYDALKPQLDEITQLRFLFGDPNFIKSLDPQKAGKKYFAIKDQNITLKNQLQQRKVAKECANWIREKVEIRSTRKSNFLHGKVYHIENQGDAHSISGSSNFTLRGLGLSSINSNREINIEIEDNSTHQELKTIFNKLWNDKELVKDVKDDVLCYLEQIYQNYAPEFIYYKTLFHLFEQFLGQQQEHGLLMAEKQQLVDTEIWQSLFDFQKDGVKGAINKIMTHNGCIIADSVGLGKTYEALAIIKYFELMNKRVLLLCPKKLRENWTTYHAQNNSKFNPFIKDKFSYTVLSHTDLSRIDGKSGEIDLERLNWGNYDLVVIDESHNFRNNIPGKRDKDGKITRKSRYQRLMEDIIQSGVPTKVLLLSATPVNNHLKDLRNQIHIITGGRDDAFQETLRIASVKNTLDTAQRTFTEWTEIKSERSSRQLLEKLSSSFFKLLDGLTIARSRRHIQKYYSKTVKKLGGFPERTVPINRFSEIDLANQFMSYDQLNQEISNYQLSMYRPSRYILDQYHHLYDTSQIPHFTQDDREYYLANMHKINFLKRLESSICSFSITMERAMGNIEKLEKQIRCFQEYRYMNPNLDLANIEPENLEDEELQTAMQVGKKLVFKLAHLDTDTWLRDLKKDKAQLQTLYLSAKNVTVKRDAKLTELKSLISEKSENPTTNKKGKLNRKVLIFTAFVDTASYLYDTLSQWALDELKMHTGLVTGGNSSNKTTLGKSDFNHILTNFSPISKMRDQNQSMPQEEEIDLMIATDCVSEGQNLQDCDYLINYDIHWNPVRIIQRFGRIDRIGSLNHKVQLVNFWPTPDLNKYIKLKNRVEERMALVDISSTTEDNLLTPDEIEKLVETDLRYREKQLLRLKEEILDMEDFSEGISLHEFTLDDFRVELMNYIESNRRALENAPEGIYTVVPAPPNNPIIAPGVIFCLRQKNESKENEKLNPLQPYFLVYIRDDGVVRFNFAQPKQILEMYQLLCCDRNQAYEQLCMLFDQQTNGGSDMKVYNDLLEQALEKISHTYQNRVIRNLMSDPSAVFPKNSEQINSNNDFDLVTWLVIK